MFFGPNSSHRAQVTPAKRGKGSKPKRMRGGARVSAELTPGIDELGTAIETAVQLRCRDLLGIAAGGLVRLTPKKPREHYVGLRAGQERQSHLEGLRASTELAQSIQYWKICFGRRSEVVYAATGSGLATLSLRHVAQESLRQSRLTDPWRACYQHHAAMSGNNACQAAPQVAGRVCSPDELRGLRFHCGLRGGTARSPGGKSHRSDESVAALGDRFDELRFPGISPSALRISPIQT